MKLELQKFLRLKYLVALLFLVAIGIGSSSCSKKTYPSGIEGNLWGGKNSYKKEQKQRERIAKREKKRTLALEKKAKKPQEKRKADSEKAVKRFKKEHRAKQHADVQSRMKENERETRRLYREQNKQTRKKSIFRKRKK